MRNNTIQFPSYAEAKAKLFKWDYHHICRHGMVEKWETEGAVALVEAQDRETVFSDSSRPVQVTFYNQ